MATKRERGSPCTRTIHIKTHWAWIKGTLSHCSNFICVLARVWRVKIGLGIYFLLFSLYATIDNDQPIERKKNENNNSNQKRIKTIQNFFITCSSQYETDTRTRTRTRKHTILSNNNKKNKLMNTLVTVF